MYIEIAPSVSRNWMVQALSAAIGSAAAVPAAARGEAVQVTVWTFTSCVMPAARRYREERAQEPLRSRTLDRTPGLGRQK